MRKRTVIWTVVLVAAATVGIAGLVHLHNERVKLPPDSGSANEVDAKLSYAVVTKDKSDFFTSDDPLTLTDSYTFVSSAEPILEANKYKSYTTIKFKDGTGIYFPESSFTYTASYGTVNKKGLITSVKSYLTVKGTTVSLEDVPDEQSELTQKVLQKIPDAYQNDCLIVKMNEAAKSGSITFTPAEGKDAKSSAQEILDAIQDVLPDGCQITWTSVASNAESDDATGEEGTITFTSTGTAFDN